MRQWLADRRGELVEAAFVYPLLILLTVGLFNLSMLGFASMMATNAAHYGARMGSVAQRNAAGVAAAAARQRIAVAPVGDYSVSVQASNARGGRVTVNVAYKVPNFFSGLTALFGVHTPPQFTGVSTATFRHEGW
ncbi:MAG TPA: pilus assembly protein [Chloroflexi bacterium]|nr:pilus assembly protein [Chloroflexota bacterium]